MVQSPITSTTRSADRNCFLQIREYGATGWNKLIPALFLSDRIDTWIPSGRDLDEAQRTRAFPLSQQDFIELLEARVIRAGVREANITQRSTSKVFLGSSGSILDEFLRRQFENGEDTVLAHPGYGGARAALEEITNWATAPATSRYTLARQYAEAHLHGGKCLPSFVVERANSFSKLPLGEIEDRDIRECMRFIRGIPSAEEQELLALSSQIVRLAVEHDSLMKAHGCEVLFGDETYSSLVAQMGKTKPYELPATAPRETVSNLANLIDYLLGLGPVTGAADVISRHEKLAPYRDAMWDLAAQPGEIDEYLLQEGLTLTPLDYAFGRDTIGQRISVGSSAFTLSKLVSTAIDAAVSPATAVASSLLAIARVIRSAQVGEQTRLSRPGTAVLGIIVYDTEKPTQKQMKRIFADLEHRIKSSRHR